MKAAELVAIVETNSDPAPSRRPSGLRKPKRRARAIVILSLLASACGASSESACELGKKKLDECGATLGPDSMLQNVVRTIGVISDECSAQDKCVGTCLEHASCAVIAYTSRSRSTDPNTVVPPGVEPFRACVSECVTQ